MFYVLTFGGFVTLIDKVVSCIVKVVTTDGKVVSCSGKVATTDGKVVSDTVKVVTRLDTFATTTG